MLVRLQDTLGCTDLVNQMLLLPQAKLPVHSTASSSEINLVVGYSHSPRSQTALDLTLWIAHQTRLATGKQVTVQVVYVIDEWVQRMADMRPYCDLSRSVEGRSTQGGTAIAQLPDTEVQTVPSSMASVFEQADRILWQARCLAEEWRGSLKTHLRFGSLAEELRTVVEAESASLMILGCESKNHPLVKQLGRGFPCSVLGIPSIIEDN
ncbi:universal stress protein [Myxacorys almedinensis A]|uniref:Universal stress protein n=2 Tax=Myxacorys TaxID=2056239 RepID=A0A8J8CHT5_9CYAN|nr:universal stress protein [Myxacorys almedinensis]NDJ17043.1 universal stress protein [Myxacorys almedinensis A]